MVQTTEKILLEFEPEAENILPVLEKISAVFGYVSKENAQKTADYFSVPLSRVFETASFYDLIKIKSQPLATVKVCSGTHCAVGESFEIIREIENYFRLKAGDENNPKVKLEIISCLGKCGDGPIVIVNEKIYERVTVNLIRKIFGELGI